MIVNFDFLICFLFFDVGVCGVYVYLQVIWQEILFYVVYLDVVVELFGEVCVVLVLFIGYIKIDGCLLVQLCSSIVLCILFVECIVVGILCGIVQFSEGGDVLCDLFCFGDDVIFVIIIENFGLDLCELQCYQSLVVLIVLELDEVFEDYFCQLEQLLICLLLVVDCNGVVGLLLQKLLGDEGDEDGWVCVSVLFEILGKVELLVILVEQLLYCLFYEEWLELLGDKLLFFVCFCLCEWVVGMLQLLGEGEVCVVVEVIGVVEVCCEFCGCEYYFLLMEFGILFYGVQGVVVVFE